MDRVSALDLTGDEAYWVEEQLGKPVDEWGGAPKGRLLPLVLAVHDAKGDAAKRDQLVADYGSRPLGELLDRFSFGDPAGKDESAQ